MKRVCYIFDCLILPEVQHSVVVFPLWMSHVKMREIQIQAKSQRFPGGNDVGPHAPQFSFVLVRKSLYSVFMY